MANVSDKIAAQWQHAVNFLLGVWLFLSPWILGYTATQAAAWNAYVLGIVIAVLGVAAVMQFQKWEAWLAALGGVWLVVSPWILGFAAIGAAMWNAVIVGLAVAILAIWSALGEHEQGGRLATRS